MVTRADAPRRRQRAIHILRWRHINEQSSRKEKARGVSKARSSPRAQRKAAITRGMLFYGKMGATEPRSEAKRVPARSSVWQVAESPHARSFDDAAEREVDALAIHPCTLWDAVLVVRLALT